MKVELKIIGKRKEGDNRLRKTEYDGKVDYRTPLKPGNHGEKVIGSVFRVPSGALYIVLSRTNNYVKLKPLLKAKQFSVLSKSFLEKSERVGQAYLLGHHLKLGNEVRLLRDKYEKAWRVYGFSGNKIKLVSSDNKERLRVEKKFVYQLEWK